VNEIHRQASAVVPPWLSTISERFRGVHLAWRKRGPSEDSNDRQPRDDDGGLGERTFDYPQYRAWRLSGMRDGDRKLPNPARILD
jgi:hypothetical protein